MMWLTQLYPKLARISNKCVLSYLDNIIFEQAELYELYFFKFALTIILIQFTFTTVGSGCIVLCHYVDDMFA